jgi:activating signal cointegrator complex subunit 3
LYHTDNNVLLGAPTGSGKTIVAELAIFRLMNINPDLKCVYIAPLKALARERIDDWSVKFGKHLGRRVVELTGDVTPDTMALNAADIIITTPEKWDGISRHWQMRSYVQKVGLVVIDEIHLLGGDRGPVLEVIVSRMRYIAAHSQEQNPVRLVGLSTALANAHDLADWLGIGKVGLYNFPPSVRPVPLTVHISGFPGKHYCPRMATMNKPAYAAITTYSPAKPVLVFVSSRRQTRLTALDLISFLAADGDPRRWLNIDSDSLEAILSGVQDQSLRHCLAFGVGLHHAGLQEDDRKIVENLFCEQKIQILVCTSTLAWGVNFPAHLVVIKGTEYYDAKVKRYVDFPITDVLQMMGRAGRPQFDTEARACILVHEPKKTFYRKFLYEPFPVESSLLTQLHDHLNAEVCGGTVHSIDDAVDWLSWTYAFRRIIQNPSYYHIESNEPDAIGTFLKNTVARVFSELAASGCLTFDEESGEVTPTALGRIASFYYLDYKTIARFSSRLNSSMELPAIVNALSAAAEFDEFPVRHNEDLVNAELSRIVPWPVDGHPPICFETPHAKVSLLMQCHFSHLPLPVSDYYTDTKSVLDQTLRVCNAIIDIAAEYGWLSTALRTMNLVQMVVQGRWLHESTLLNLPHATSKMTIAFKKRGLDCLPEVMDALTRDSNAVVQILRDSGLGAKQSADVQSVLRKLPVLEVDRSISSANNTMTIALSLNRANQDAVARGSAGGGKAVRAYTPYFPKPKEVFVCVLYPMHRVAFQLCVYLQEGWWIVIGRGIELLALKRSALTHGRCKVNIEIPYSAEPITVYVMSDCYLGLDQQYQCQIPSE